jgi:glutamyl/glutaminyl-tRNA synthetase
VFRGRKNRNYFYNTNHDSVFSIFYFMNISTESAFPVEKTRIAPTPSGYLHLGNLFSFALTLGLATHRKARIMLRIDDLDRQRIQPAYIQDIFDTLEFLEIPWHEGPRNAEEFERDYSQLLRMDLYNQALHRLKEKGVLFACDCSRSKILQADPTGVYNGHCRDRGLPLDTPEVNWRLRTDDSVSLTIKTLGGHKSEFLPAEQRDFIVRKKDGFPSYQLTSLVDDQHFGINLITRGMDLWPSTLAQMYLAGVLGIDSFINTTFYHHGLLKTADGEKLSKSAGDTSIQFLRKQGKTAKEISNLITLQAVIDRAMP